MVKFPSNVRKMNSTLYVRIPPALAGSLGLEHNQQVSISIINKHEMRVTVDEV